MTRNASVSVVMCAYTEDRWDDLRAAVDSLQQQTQPVSEIIVVIDHNRALADRVRDQIPGVVVVENSGQQGLSGARNTGILLARGEIIAFIDEDAVAAPDWVEQLMTAYDRSDVIGTGGPIIPWWLHGRPRWFADEFDWVVGCTFRGMPETTSQVGRLIGCNMSFRREAFEEVGGFRSGIGRIGTRPLAGEETEFSIRLAQRWPNKQMVYEPRARVFHRVPQRRANWGYFVSRCYCEGLSKAAITRMVGSGDGLSSERSYVLRTLPLGVFKGLGDLMLRQDRSGLARAAVIIAGLTITLAGYMRGSLAAAELPSAVQTLATNKVRG